MLMRCDDAQHSATNEARIARLCDWIRDNAASNPGWPELIAQSGFNHRDLIMLFGRYRKTTPMAYVRQCQQGLQDDGP